MSIIDDINAEAIARGLVDPTPDVSGKLRMTAEVYGHKYTAEGPEDMTLDHLLGRIVCPLLLDMGYQPESLTKLFKDGNPMGWDSAYED